MGETVDERVEILVAEDSHTQAEALRYQLEKGGFAVRVAMDGAQALAAARQSKPRLVIGDIEMPVMDGYEMCRALKNDPSLRDIPVLLLTSLSNPDDVLRGLECGADYYLTKPYGIARLLAQVETALRDDERTADGRVAPMTMSFNGRRHTIQAGPRQILNLLLSTYASAVERNEELVAAKAELARANQDLTDQSQKLKQSEERYRAVVHQTADAIYLVDASTRRVTDSNPAFRTMLGYTPQELDEITVYDFVAHDRADIDHRLQELMDAPTHMTGERQYRRKDGTIVDVEVSAGTITFGGRKVVCTIARDISERKRAQELLRDQNQRLDEAARSEHEAHEQLKRTQSQLVQSEKLAGLGQMVAGIAHEINNPLAFVSNNVAVLRRDMAALTHLIEMYRDAEPSMPNSDLLTHIHEFCERIDLSYTSANIPELLCRSLDGLKRIQQIVKDLRDFARLDESDLTEVDINSGIESTVNIIHGKAVDRGTEIKLELETIPKVMCYAAKVNQVVMNLLSNAIDAAPEKGTVTVRTRPAAGGVQIEVMDNGAGIDPSIRERIFDPFFTTKPIGCGTGLGLSVSYSIIRDHKGSIEVTSPPGQGATFIVTLPLAPPKEEPKPKQ